jgi:hypothetical protein
VTSVGDAAKVLAVALGLGFALGIVLTGTGPGASGFIRGEYWILVIVAASVTLGWFAAQLGFGGAAVLVSAIGVVLMLAVVLGVKYLRLPEAPLVGDGFPVLMAIYAACGTLGALLGQAKSMRAATRAAAARTALCLSAAVLTASIALYALASVSGS